MKRGFTVLEFIIILVILSMLFSIAMPSVKKSYEKARIQQAEEEAEVVIENLF